MPKEMLQHAQRIMQRAYAPYSEFKVGACIRTESGRLHSGCNIENASYGMTQCAEASAVAHMIAAGDTRIEEVVIISDSELHCSPCGGCRQILREFAHSVVPVHMFATDGSYKTLTMGELLPDSFGPEHLED